MAMLWLLILPFQQKVQQAREVNVLSLPHQQCKKCNKSEEEKERNHSKSDKFNRDVILLPQAFQLSSGEISVPHSAKRNKLGEAGLIGKIELSSAMREEEVCTEIFAMPILYTVLLQCV